MADGEFAVRIAASIGAFTKAEWQSLSGTTRDDPGRLQSVPVLRIPDEPRGIRLRRAAHRLAGPASQAGRRRRRAARRGALLCQVAQPGRICLRSWLGGCAGARRRQLLSEAADLGPVHAGDGAAAARQGRLGRDRGEGGACGRAEGRDRSARRFLGACHLRAEPTTSRCWTRPAFCIRTDQQFHFFNNGYGSYDDFLDTLASRKRKALKKERREALSAGITRRLADRQATSPSAPGTISSPSTWTPAAANGAGPTSTASSSR